MRDWFGNGEQISLRGKLELLQQTEYDITNTEVSLEGLGGKMSGYHVHMVTKSSLKLNEIFYIVVHYRSDSFLFFI